MGLFDIFSPDQGIAAAGQAKRAGKKATGKASDLASKGYTKAAAPIKSATTKQVGSLTEGLAPFEELFGQNQDAETLRLDALGVNGPEAAAAARAAFQESPGSRYAQDMAAQTILRNRAAAGGLNAGGTATDLNDYAQNYAFNQQWQPWLEGLGKRDPQSSAQGMAGVLTNIGDVYGTEGVNLSNLATNKFNTLGNLALKRGDINSQYQQDVFGAKQGALNNQWGAINAGLGLGTKLLGMGFG